MYIKDFDGWNNEKQRINKTDKKRFFKEREIWWCALGINIGVEIDGKNGAYERPVLIFKYRNPFHMEGVSRRPKPTMFLLYTFRYRRQTV
jgi:hypothetical protein